MTYAPPVNRACEATPPTDSPEYRLTPGHCPLSLRIAFVSRFAPASLSFLRRYAPAN